VIAYCHCPGLLPDDYAETTYTVTSNTGPFDAGVTSTTWAGWDEDRDALQELRQAHREECRQAFRRPQRRSGKGYRPEASPVPADRSRLLGATIRARRAR
jgi:hypothetical protein